MRYSGVNHRIRASLHCLAAGLMLMPIVLSAAAPGGAIALPAPDRILAVSDDMRRFLAEQVSDHAQSPLARQRLLMEAVFSQAGLDLTYDDSVTRTVSETFRDRRGNCLSFTLLYVALARELGLNVSYQEVSDSLWHRQGDTILKRAHINVLAHLSGRRHIVDFEPGLQFAAPRTRIVSEARALAHFYNNRGMELLLDGRVEEGVAWVRRATELDPRFVPAWSNLGVALRKSGRDSEAERAYRAALEMEPLNVQALSNLMSLMQRRQDADEAARLEKRLRQARRGDPYSQYEDGLAAERHGNLDQALRLFRRAVRLQPGDEMFHLAQFRVYYRLGDQRRAQEALVRAGELARAGPDSAIGRKFGLLGLTPPNPAPAAVAASRSVRVQELSPPRSTLTQRVF